MYSNLIEIDSVIDTSLEYIALTEIIFDIEIIFIDIESNFSISKYLIIF